MLQISPSIMCADLMNLGRELALIEAGGADWVHVDVMDGHFVPGFTFGADAIRQIRAATSLPIEVHLMSDQPLAQIGDFIDAGTDLIYIHSEIGDDLHRVLATIRRAGCRAGVVLNPGTPDTALSEIIEVLDAVLVMTVCPGFVGQPILRNGLEKAKRLLRWRRVNERENLKIAVDGGVKLDHIAELTQLGIDRAISGTGVFGTGISADLTVRRMKEIGEASGVTIASRHLPYPHSNP